MHLGKAKGLPGPVDGKVLGGAMSSGRHAANTQSPVSMVSPSIVIRLVVFTSSMSGSRGAG
jgi:hypothetical protein